MSALRTRVNISETGSAAIDLSLPARLRHARDFTRQREFSKTDTTQRKLAKEAARASAVLATVTELGGELARLSSLARAFESGRFLLFFCDLCSCCHLNF